MRGRDKFKKVKVFILIGVFICKLLPNFVKIFIWDFISKYSQLPFIGLRYVLLKTLCKKCGSNIRIGANVRMLNLKQLEIGDNVSIHDYCYIDASGGISIGDNVSIAHNCSILSTNHTWANLELPIKYNSVTKGKVYIEDDVWLGCGVRLLAGVNVKSRCIIAAGAVLNKNTVANHVYGGVPAKIIKEI